MKWEPKAAFIVEEGDEWAAYEQNVPDPEEPFGRIDDIRYFGSEWVSRTKPAIAVDHPSELAHKWLHKGRFEEIYLMYADGRIDVFDVVMTEWTGTGSPDGHCAFQPLHSDSDGSEDDRLSDWNV